ncbi:hypothetical protein CICLE_v10012452mg [Citrus x clementina]|uniref:DUF7086 domain-containing protein n=1 Tax=Citrus clementina TaxID=85681 RepID=V4SNJ8_CITCL|nr:uncharacterized protein LOC18038060 [Citrus x clementina]ESR42237.1 hypothetical protein CICLE_v10012452mg [Citrus x clementina]
MKRSMSSPLNDSARHDKENHEDLLKLSLSTGSRAVSSSPLGQTYHHHPITTVPSTPASQFSESFFLVTPPPSTLHHQDITANNNSSMASAAVGSSSSRSRNRKSPVQKLRPGKTETIPAPFPWATTRRATVHSLEYLTSHNMNKISGEVQCKRCEQKYEIEYDLHAKFMEVASFISENKYTMHDRAPAIWMNPNLPNCKFCGQSNCVKPILGKKKSINWLFLLLGHMLGCCKLSELKYFCKHTRNHRTGAKDRVLYLTYLSLCKQLDPNGLYD